MTATTPPVMEDLIGRSRWYGWRTRCGCALLRSRRIVEWQYGDDAGTAGVSLSVENDLVGAAEDALHGLEVEPLARDVRRLLVFLIDLQEARSLAVRLGDGLLAIGFGGLGDLRRPAARLGHHPIGVGLGLVLRTLRVGARRLHVAERVR